MNELKRRKALKESVDKLLSVEERLALMSSEWSTADFCNHHDKNGKYTLSPYCYDKVVCSKCHNVFTMCNNDKEADIISACKKARDVLQTIVTIADIPHNLQDAYHHAIYLLARAPECLNLAKQIQQKEVEELKKGGKIW